MMKGSKRFGDVSKIELQLELAVVKSFCDKMIELIKQSNDEDLKQKVAEMIGKAVALRKEPHGN